VPPLMVPGSDGPILLDSNALFAVCIGIAVVVAVLLSILRRRPFGRIVAGVRENELRTSLLGYDIRRYKLVSFVIGGAVAGLAGGLYAAWGLFINPAVFGLQQAALVAIWVLVGGRDSIVGAFVGVALVQGLSSTLGGGGGSATPIVLGAVLIAVVLAVPRGLVPTAAALLRRVVPRPHTSTAAPSAAEDTAALDSGLALSARSTGLQAQPLEVGDLYKSFGGVHALRGVSLSLPARSVQCLIGPNGAGKSTCFNLLAGRYRPTKGEIRLGTTDITRLRPDQRARLGIGIKLQVPSYYAPLTAFENVWLAGYSRLGDAHAADARASEILGWLGLADKSAMPAGFLSHGEHQWLEIGMVVAGEPVVILLDEPTAGMSREETLRTVQLIRTLATNATVVVVEHDMEFVRVLDAPVTMFHEGAVFARGSVEELRADDRVLDIYLGRTAESDVAS
jgi:branched-chain amino acid transport system permease protein